METVYQVEGMKCQGCADTVKSRIQGLEGVQEAVVDLGQAQVTVKGQTNPEAINAALEGTRFRVHA